MSRVEIIGFGLGRESDLMRELNRRERARKAWYLVGDVLRWSGGALLWGGFGYAVARITALPW